MAVVADYGPLNRWMEAVDDRLKEGERDARDIARQAAADREKVAVLTEKVDQMIEAFKAFRTALYAAAGTILVAAILIMIVGKHP